MRYIKAIVLGLITMLTLLSLLFVFVLIVSFITRVLGYQAMLLLPIIAMFLLLVYYYIDTFE